MSCAPGRTGGQWPRIPGASVTGRCARDESARNAGGTPGCGTADGAARRTRGTQTGSPPVPAGRGCRRPAWAGPAEREAAAARVVPVRTQNACTRVRTHRTGSPAPRPALCRAAAARAAGCSMRSCIHVTAQLSVRVCARPPEPGQQTSAVCAGVSASASIRGRRLPCLAPRATPLKNGAPACGATYAGALGNRPERGDGDHEGNRSQRSGR